ncbi:DUF6803 family protein [Cellulomonas fimi]|uniref:Permease n=1 Tax=Cellulomonas fimi (strain ATCC 484 / DSM 20113 / JCM 1341 / CCUG 24087 / LMG 16345 / NBRC 15513 / NCIMB 8980 / NCTC 7547 / NRS-133) TaxID=590998 RepID=F4H4J9_CELFA|nr:DUF6803 family protein [Cellulomonas fimi]AEE47794.1 hypothetical protein Celf_3687 [Cellulomonas fimi ATCC 484]VEH37015.1 Uncharacterised protein [Cellulomonas fimi]
MVTTAPSSAGSVDRTSAVRGHGTRVAAVAAVSVVIAAVALLLPAWPAGEDMGSTHYMGLLAANQPWNLLLFMAVPVILAETIAVSELAILFRRQVPVAVARLNRYAGLVVGFYFLGVVVYLMRHAVVPLTTSGGWRGWVDVVAVGFYLLGIVPLYGMTLLETRVVGAGWDDRRRLQVHATLVGVFLVVAHVAMIAGMLDPAVAGWEPTHVMDDGSSMEGMTH